MARFSYAVLALAALFHIAFAIPVSVRQASPEPSPLVIPNEPAPSPAARSPTPPQPPAPPAPPVTVEPSAQPASPPNNSNNVGTGDSQAPPQQPVESPASSPDSGTGPGAGAGTDPAATVEAEPSPTPVCFPASATVELEDGSKKTMDKVQLGDRVKVGAGKFSEVFMFTHKLDSVIHSFVKMTTSSGSSLSLTSGHYMYINGALTAAGNAKVGDTVELADGSTANIVSLCKKIDRGLYNPQTVHGDIVVDGIRASTYTTTIAPNMAHAMLAPLRLVYSRLGFTTALFDAGSDAIGNVLSRVPQRA